MAITLTTKTGVYINPSTLGQYPNATIEYNGDKNFPNQEKFIIIFTLKSEGGHKIQDINWVFKGRTPSGNQIQNHGELTWSGNTGSTDFVTYLLDNGDLDDPSLEVVVNPTLSYDDLDTYFDLGSKKASIGVPSNAQARKLVKWMLLNTVNLGRETIGTQFSF